MSQLLPLKTKSKVNVLIIDDEIKLLDTLKNYLESKGISVCTAQSVQQALYIMKSLIPDILIVDIMMPYETGYDFILSLKKTKRFSTIPFIFLTAKGMTKDRIKGYSLGCRAYIIKPFDPEELITVIRSIINEIKNIQDIKKIKNEIRQIRFYLENKNSIYVKFTNKEQLIFLEIIKGKTNRSIAEAMQVSLRNIEKYVTRLLHKTYSRNRTDLIKFSNIFYSSLKANDENRTRE